MASFDYIVWLLLLLPVIGSKISIGDIRNIATQQNTLERLTYKTLG